jgi:hypothetical protein
VTQRVLVSLLVLPLLVVSCGGDDGKDEKAAFIAKAESICAKANADQKALSTPTAVAQLAPYVAKVVAIADQATTALLALDLPDKDAKDIDAKVITPLKDQVAVGKRYAAQVAAADKAKNQSELLRLLGNPPTETKADLRWMKSYGFKACIDAADTTG